MSIFDGLLKPRQQTADSAPSTDQPASPEAATIPSEGVDVGSDAALTTDSVPDPVETDGGFQFDKTGNPDVDAALAAQAQKIAKLLQDARASATAQPKPTEQDGQETAPQSDQKPAELPRQLYENHFKTTGNFPDDNAQNLSKTVPDVALHAVNTVYKPVIERFEQMLTALQEKVDSLDGVRTQLADQQWRGVRSLFGPGADALKDQALALSKSKKISLHAALVELNPALVRAQQQARQQANQTGSPQALRSAIPAGRSSFGSGDKAGGSNGDLNDQFQMLKQQMFQENAKRRGR